MAEPKSLPNLQTELGEEKYQDFLFVKDRIEQLKQSRQNVYGTNLDILWNQADQSYIPHRLKTKGKRVIATDEEKGWRGNMVTLGADDWQSDISQPNPFIKIQVALSILIDRNPEGVFSAGSGRYEANTLLMKNLYERSWEMAKSKQQLKLFVFNLAKYGWSIGKTYPLKITRKVKNLVKYNEQEPDKSEYEKKEVVEYNDVYRETLDARNSWIDDMARPNNEMSLRDWAYRKVYAYDAAEEEFGKYKNFQYVPKTGGVTEEVLGQPSTKKFQERNLLEVYFYENILKDLFMVIVGGVPVVIEPLPISDSEGHKKLSCWQTYWLLRHGETPYGIGIWEAMREDQRTLDKIRNMTIDQLVMSIYKMFFYQGTASLTEGGKIKLSPGVGQQIVDPKNLKWLEIMGPGTEAWKGIEMFKNDIDEASGVTKPLGGEVTGKTAFEIAQAKEAALKRLKTPLDNITDALDTEAYITVSLIQLLYSTPEIYKIAEPEKIEAYLKEIKGDTELYERGENDEFTAKVYREVSLGLDKNEKGDLVETEQTRFFRTKPKGLLWSGIIRIKSQSVLVISKELQKAMDLEFANLVIPLLAQDPAIVMKPVKQLCKIYDKDFEDWIPDSWLQKPEEEPLVIPAMGRPQAGGMTPEMVAAMGGQAPQGGGQLGNKVVPTTELNRKPTSTIGRIGRQMRKAIPFLGGK